MALEQSLQKKIQKKLEADDWLCVKLIKTTMNGIPDLMALKDGKTMFIEVKTPKGILSELQKIRIEQLKKQGFEVKIWTDYGVDYIQRT